jgi:uncharacterized protein YyaL (SSP411 family)
VNRLAGETSPYLRQHRDNPVDWYPWGAEAFQAARRRDVPILLSVGYSACHWCHVMAHESFDDPEVAAAMNANFVCIKVDREERPDVDALYMDAVQALTGRGGWPMTVAIDPDGRPFWGGTYFPKPQLLKVLEAIDDVWRNRRGDLEQNAVALVKAIGRSAATEPKPGIPGRQPVNVALQQLSQAFDAEWGGFGSAPKFPSTSHLELILRAYMTTGSDDAKLVLTTTLDAMASGGMYDHIGGGFARYSTDRHWLVPHFEKMLYDQALLVRVYRQAYSTLGGEHYRQVVEETIAYVLRDLRQPDGGFASAEDADSPAAEGDRHGHEGLFHTWTPAEVRAALVAWPVPVVESVCEWYGITDEGNFAEGGVRRSIPHRSAHRGELARPPHVDEARRLMFAARQERPRPGLDDKVLTEWNALFLWALADAAAVFQRDDWKVAAVANAEFLLGELRDDRGRWRRSWQVDGSPRARHMALAADHAALVLAFQRLGELTGEARWVRAALETADTMLDWYWDPQQGGLYTTAEDAEGLVVRQKDLIDGATPSANSMAADGLMRLAALTGEQRYANHADRILQLLGTVIEQYPGGVSNALLAVESHHRGWIELAIVGDRPALVRLAQSLWRPDLVLAWGEPFDSPLWESRQDGFAYLCRGFACEAPVSTPEALYERLTGRRAPDGMSFTTGSGG